LFAHMSTSSLYYQVRDARRQKGLTQAELARQAGCTQSALSMFESGQDSALATETLRKIAGLLGIAFEESPAAPPLVAGRVFCPNFQCPAAFPYCVGDELLVRPYYLEHARHCPHCGEVLLAACPHCGSPAGEHFGACCATCGKHLAPAALPGGVAPREWLRARRAEAAVWRE